MNTTSPHEGGGLAGQRVTGNSGKFEILKEFLENLSLTGEKIANVGEIHTFPASSYTLASQEQTTNSLEIFSPFTYIDNRFVRCSMKNPTVYLMTVFKLSW